MRIPAFIALVLSYLVLSALFYLLIPGNQIDPETFDAVSGLYGPGSCCAWLLLVLSNTEFKLCYIYLRRVFRGDFPVEDNDHHTTKVDAAIVGSVAYPFVAFVDFIRREEAYREYETIDAAIHAQLSIIHLATAASILAVTVPCFPAAYLSYVRHPESILPLPDPRRRLVRLLIWCCPVIMAQLMSCSQRLINGFRLSLGANMLEAAKILDIQCIVWVGLWTVDPGRHENLGFVQTAVAWVVVGIFTLSSISAITVFHDLLVGTNKTSSLAFAFPRSSAKLTDLDQAAALAIAVSTLALSTIRAARRRADTSRG